MPPGCVTPPAKQQVDYFAFGNEPLASLLQFTYPPLRPIIDAHRQLRYVESYVDDLGCRSLILERHYIDRDYMEDHAVFYSKNLQAFPNSCQRIHFFTCDVRTLRRQWARILSLSNSTLYSAECAFFSEQFYLGFCVVKPLPGCPIGRTVLKHKPAEGKSGYTRRFDCACDYKVHVMGIALKVRGLAFQQQDVGVSACATTALWSALQRARVAEQGSAATPAQISIRATQYALPFGRPMPAEGLSIDQMCQAVRSLGLSPNLLRADSFDLVRAQLHSAVISGIAPVLTLRSTKDKQLWHAVAVAGIKEITPHRCHLYRPYVDDVAGDLHAVYIHDDRHGPYLVADLSRGPKDETLLRVRLTDPTQNVTVERWQVMHVLIPMHPKINISLGELHTIAIEILGEVHGLRGYLGVHASVTTVEKRIVRAHAYVESLITGKKPIPPAATQRFCSSVPLSRYLGIVSIEAPDLDPTDVVIDTTSTVRNLNYLAVVVRSKERTNTRHLTLTLAKRYSCQLI